MIITLSHGTTEDIIANPFGNSWENVKRHVRKLPCPTSFLFILLQFSVVMDYYFLEFRGKKAAKKGAAVPREARQFIDN